MRKESPGLRDQRATRVLLAPPEGRGSAIIDCFVPDRRNHDQRLLHRHVQRLPVGAADERRALRRQPQFDNPARHDRLRKTIVGKPLSWRARLPLEAAWNRACFLPGLGFPIPAPPKRPSTWRASSMANR